MTETELDHAYTVLCGALGTASGGADAETTALGILGRFALLAILEIDDAARIEELIRRAAAGKGRE